MTEHDKKRPEGDPTFYIGGDVGPGAAVGPNAQVTANNIAGRDINIGVDMKDISDAFAKIYSAVEAAKFAKPEDALNAREAVELIKEENDKGDKANEKTVRLSFRTLAQMAPEIWEVAVNTLVNPVLGISTVVRKIAEKAKEEAEAEKKQ